ncbi:hypothetical protein LC065_13030 [Halobacillus litoralis]|uniref:hypothetical protein n=1 Tax=Halobacillus litoralis TaxID=45668 RepID=UPI001CFF2335|nr:hypothetical protein [Halobacillus litoralis]WLR46492.1 hypothetical protein LC065_13030 [Halobacillus litoralis]
MEEFPIIHTNVWDAVIAVPSVIILTELIKIFLKPSKGWVPSIANVLGLGISIFIAHKSNLSAGIFMGLFYGNAAVGGYASIKTSLQVLREKRKNND